MLNKLIFLKNNRFFWLAALISLLFVIFIYSPLIYSILHTPAGTVNMLVGHYWEDYYVYLTGVSEGLKGQIFVTNLASITDHSRMFLSWWPYTALGFIFYFLRINLSPQNIYWLGAGFLLFVYCLLTYPAIDQLTGIKRRGAGLAAFLFCLLSTGFFRVISNGGKIDFVPFDHWYSIGLPYSRFGVGTPHHELAQIIFLLGIMIIGRKLEKEKVFPLFSSLISGLLLLTIAPPQFLLFTASVSAGVIFYIVYAARTEKKSNSEHLFYSHQKLLFPLTVYLVISVLAAFWVRNVVLATPVMEQSHAWDLNHFFYPGVSLFLLSMGPLLMLAIIGLPIFFRKVTVTGIIYFSVAFFSLVPVVLRLGYGPFDLLRTLGFHNLRFLTPVSFIFLSVASAELLEVFFRKKLYFGIVSGILILFFLFPLKTTGVQRLKEPESAGYLQYMPSDMYSGLKFPEKSFHKGVVLTSPDSSLGLAVAAIDTRQVYIGHFLFTPDIEGRKALSFEFYKLKMDPEAAREFLLKNRIEEIVVYLNDGDSGKMKDYYPFLKEEFKNSQITVFTVD